MATPTLDVSGAATYENDFATVTGTISDPGTQDTFTLSVDWGDGTTETYLYGTGTASFSVSHQYLDDNPTATPYDDYAVSLTLTDDDTGATTGSATVRVYNVDPAVTVTASGPIRENDSTTLGHRLARGTSSAPTSGTTTPAQVLRTLQWRFEQTLRLGFRRRTRRIQ